MTGAFQAPREQKMISTTSKSDPSPMDAKVKRLPLIALSALAVAEQIQDLGDFYSKDLFPSRWLRSPS